jgi:hypothetical protein
MYIISQVEPLWETWHKSRNFISNFISPVHRRRHDIQFAKSIIGANQKTKLHRQTQRAASNVNLLSHSRLLVNHAYGKLWLSYSFVPNVPYLYISSLILGTLPDLWDRTVLSSKEGLVSGRKWTWLLRCGILRLTGVILNYPNDSLLGFYNVQADMFALTFRTKKCITPHGVKTKKTMTWANSRRKNPKTQY